MGECQLGRSGCAVSAARQGEAGFLRRRPVEHRDIADPRDQGGPGAVYNLGNGQSARLPVIACDPELDQFVVGKLRLQFGQEGVGYARGAEAGNRLQRVGESPQVLALLFGEFCRGGRHDEAV